MSDPRNVTDFSEINVRYITIAYDSTIVYDAAAQYGGAQGGVNLAVALKGNRTVGLAEDGDHVVGELVQVEKTVCLVKTGGFLVLKGGSGATLTRGKRIVGALGAASAKGYIREVAVATAAELGVADGEIFDTSDTSAVLVHYK